MLLSHLTYKVLLLSCYSTVWEENTTSHFTYKALPQFIVWNKQWIGFCLLHFSFALKRKPSAFFLRCMRRFRLLPIPKISTIKCKENRLCDFPPHLFSILSYLLSAPLGRSPYLSGIATYEVFHHLYLLYYPKQKKELFKNSYS